MKARQHRGGFKESMLTMREIPATLEAVYEFFNVYDMMPFDISQIEIIDYDHHDNREGWDAKTFLVVVRGIGPVGQISESVSIPTQVNEISNNQEAE